MPNVSNLRLDDPCAGDEIPRFNRPKGFRGGVSNLGLDRKECADLNIIWINYIPSGSNGMRFFNDDWEEVRDRAGDFPESTIQIFCRPGSGVPIHNSAPSTVFVPGELYLGDVSAPGISNSDILEQSRSPSPTLNPDGETFNFDNFAWGNEFLNCLAYLEGGTPGTPIAVPSPSFGDDPNEPFVRQRLIVDHLLTTNHRFTLWIQKFTSNPGGSGGGFGIQFPQVCDRIEGTYEELFQQLDSGVAIDPEGGFDWERYDPDMELCCDPVIAYGEGGNEITIDGWTFDYLPNPGDPPVDDLLNWVAVGIHVRRMAGKPVY